MTKKENISSYQLLCLVFIFLVGSTAILQSTTAAERDTWISTILAIGAGGLTIFLITFLASRFPGKSLIEYSQELFGKIPGKLLGIVYLWYFLHLGSLVLINYGEFLSTVVFPETDARLFHLTMGLVVAYMVYKGIEVTARIGEIILPVFVGFFSFQCWYPLYREALSFRISNPFWKTVLEKCYWGLCP